MPYEAILQDLVRSVDRVEGALLLDATGEVVIAAGSAQMRHRLIGAYQGIVLGQAQRMAGRHALGGVRFMLWRHGGGTVIVRPLRDGYYLVVYLAPEGDVARGVHRSAGVQERLNEALGR
ncbi:MAG TPA: roadblock/LC7 domain-containing protein [Vicinamibacteria bacterium]|nr:roadblock/LC7 domain-containing protein [Vicinamibacteria bacterium]